MTLLSRLNESFLRLLFKCCPGEKCTVCLRLALPELFARLLALLVRAEWVPLDLGCLALLGVRVAFIGPLDLYEYESLFYMNRPRALLNRVSLV